MNFFVYFNISEKLCNFLFKKIINFYKEKMIQKRKDTYKDIFLNLLH